MPWRLGRINRRSMNLYKSQISMKFAKFRPLFTLPTASCLFAAPHVQALCRDFHRLKRVFFEIRTMFFYITMQISCGRTDWSKRAIIVHSGAKYTTVYCHVTPKCSASCIQTNPKSLLRTKWFPAVLRQRILAASKRGSLSHTLAVQDNVRRSGFGTARILDHIRSNEWICRHLFPKVPSYGK